MSFEPRRGVPDEWQPDESQPNLPQPDEVPPDETGVPHTSMSGAPGPERRTGSMSGLGPDEVDETVEPGPMPSDRPLRAPSGGGSATTGGTGMIGGFDQPVIDQPTIDQEVSPRRGTPETES